MSSPIRSGIVTIDSAHSFGDTVRRLLSTFASHGVKVFAILDQQAEASSVDLAMPPTTLILFGNPKAGTPLMLAQPESGLDLPLKVLVFESPQGQVRASFNEAEYIVDRHSLPREFVSNLEPAGTLIERALQAG